MTYPRPQDVIPTSEASQFDLFCCMYREVLGRMAADPRDPSVIEQHFAQMVTESIWLAKRVGVDGSGLQSLVVEVGRHEGRRNLALEIRERASLRDVVAADVANILKLKRSLDESMREQADGLVVLEGGRG